MWTQNRRQCDYISDKILYLVIQQNVYSDVAEWIFFLQVLIEFHGTGWAVPTLDGALLYWLKNSAALVKDSLSREMELSRVTPTSWEKSSRFR